MASKPNTRSNVNMDKSSIFNRKTSKISEFLIVRRSRYEERLLVKELK